MCVILIIKKEECMNKKEQQHYERQMDKKERQHHDRRMEKIRLHRAKQRKRNAIIVFEVLLLGVLVFIAVEMHQNGRFQMTDITGISEEIMNSSEEIE